jgi:hypothetical protein
VDEGVGGQGPGLRNSFARYRAVKEVLSRWTRRRKRSWNRPPAVDEHPRPATVDDRWPTAPDDPDGANSPSPTPPLSARGRFRHTQRGGTGCPAPPPAGRGDYAAAGWASVSRASLFSFAVA